MPTGIVCQTRVPEEVSRLSPDFVPRREWYGPTLIPATVAMPLAGAVAAVTWNPIPQVFKYLELSVYARGDTVATFVNYAVTLNNDTGNNYDNTRNNWDGAGLAGPGSTVAGANMIMGAVSASTAPANNFDMLTLVIPAYTSTVGHKTCLSRFGLKVANTAAGTRTGIATGWWRSTAAITRIDITASAGNFIVGSAFYLYGYS